MQAMESADRVPTPVPGIGADPRRRGGDRHDHVVSAAGVPVAAARPPGSRARRADSSDQGQACARFGARRPGEAARARGRDAAGAGGALSESAASTRSSEARLRTALRARGATPCCDGRPSAMRDGRGTRVRLADVPLPREPFNLARARAGARGDASARRERRRCSLRPRSSTRLAPAARSHGHRRRSRGASVLGRHGRWRSTPRVRRHDLVPVEPDCSAPGSGAHTSG